MSGCFGLVYMKTSCTQTLYVRAQAAARDQGMAVEPAMSPKEHGRLMARLIPLFRVRRGIHALLAKAPHHVTASTFYQECVLCGWQMQRCHDAPD